MRLTRFKSFFAAAALMGLAAGVVHASGPSDREIKQALVEHLDSIIEVSSMKIEERETLGTKTSPEVATRFKAKAILVQPLFKQIRPSEVHRDLPLYNLPEAIYLRRVTEPGIKMDMAGTTSSVRRGDGWATTVNFETIEPAPSGSPRSSFEGLPYPIIVAGTPEADALLAGVKARSKAAAEARKQREAEEAALKAKAAAIEAKRKQEEAALRATLTKQFEENAFTSLAGEAISPKGKRYDLKFNLKKGEGDKVSGTVEWTTEKIKKSVEGTMATGRNGLPYILVSDAELLNPQDFDKRAASRIQREVFAYELQPSEEDPSKIKGYWGRRKPVSKSQLTLQKVGS